MQLTLAEIATMIESPVPNSPETMVAGYSIDSRTIQPGELFFAVQGKRLDGHAYVAAALEAGAAAAVVAAGRTASFGSEWQSKLLPVSNPLAALQALAAGVRRRWGGPVVAITGSAGKTSTKQMIASLLRTQFRVLENVGNLNNQFGLPLSLLRLEPETEIGVFEMGMSGPGEIRLLANLAKPHVGVVTNVGDAHLEFFPNVQAIARAKLELMESLGADDWAVLNADDPRVASFGVCCRGHVLYYGVGESADIRAEDLELGQAGGYSFRLPPPTRRSMTPGPAWKGTRAVASLTNSSSPARFHLPLIGRHNVSNVLAALGVAYLFGLEPPALAAAVSSLRAASQRGELVRLANGALVVDDCYNSSPAALEAMLRAVAEMPARRRYAVLGAMMELGSTSEQLHYRCGRRVAELGFAGLTTVGNEARPLAAGALTAGLPEAAIAECATAEEAGERLRELLREGDVVLLKASRAVHLEKLWDHLGPRAAAPQEVTAGAGSSRRGGGA
ncbi:MAG: UDP-N-acetylmuramoyl-tripeptide--D-alanyl-D-alanine ligase [Acidobacteria bacterium]|nr:UDP-N-acetylmuramoyl-tripeptide--D-alanyl-D-alanine ligase [Acidobacteriota bacterium]